MSKNKITFLLIILIVTFASSCRNSEQFDHLLHAESIIDEMPDSALTILERIAPESLRSDKEKALYGLLLTEAKMKNHIEVVSDSLIARSADYFLTKGDKIHAIPALYYYGRTAYLLNDSPKAISLYFQAKDMAEEQEEWFWAGMACRGISDIYCDNYNFEDELRYAQKEHEFLQLSGQQPYINYALFDLCRAMHNSGHPNRVIDLCEDLKDSAIVSGDPYLNYLADRQKGLCYYIYDRDSVAAEIYSKLCSNEYADNTDSLYWCLSLISSEQLHKAESIFSNVAKSDTALCSYISYKINKLSNKPENALQNLEDFHEVSDKVFKLHISNTYISIVTDHYSLARNLAKAKLKTTKLQLLLICISGVLVIGCAISFLIYQRKRHITEINQRISIAMELQDALDLSQNDNSLKTRLIKGLLESKYETIEHLTSIMYHNPDAKIAKKKISSTVESLINELSTDNQKFISLAHEIDLLFDNLFTNLITDIPNIKEIDQRLYIFSVLHLSNSTIAHLLNLDSPSYVYNRKRHLKDKIKKLAAEKSSIYLSFIQ